MLRADREKGFTLVELAVAMSIMLLVAGALFAALDSGTKAERTASTRIDDEQAVSLTLEQLSRDVRTATVLLPATNPDQVDLGLLGGHEVRWWYDSLAGTLWRQVPDVANPGGWIRRPLAGLVNGPGTVFRFLAPDGSVLDPANNIDDVLACTTTLEVSVSAIAHPPSHPFTQTADAPMLASLDRRGCP